MTIKWVKAEAGGYKSKCGRFAIERFIRRYGIEWGLIDHLVPVEPSVSGCHLTFAGAKRTAEWRLVNRIPSNEN